MTSETMSDLITSAAIFIILYFMYQASKCKKDKIVATIIVFLAIAVCCILFAILIGPRLFNLAFSFGFISEKMSDSDSIKYFLDSLFSVVIGAITYQTVNQKLK